MRQRIDRIFELHSVSTTVAWKLVDTLYGQNTPVVVSASAFSVIGLMAFIGTGSAWYLAGLGFSTSIGILRLWQNRLYRRCRNAASPVGWAWRSALGGWATSAGWGAWSLTFLFEQQKSIVVLVAATQGACVLGGVVRHGAMRAIGDGQAYLTLIPLFLVLVVSGDLYLQAYAVFALLQLATALALGRHLSGQSLALICQAEEKTYLLSQLASANHRLEALNQDLETLAATDALTGIANRRAFDVASAREWRRATRDQTSMALLMIDIDDFKAYNDHYGHPAGDACLRNVAMAIQSGLQRPADLAARYGGEEFAVILPATDGDGMSQVVTRVQSALAGRAVPHAGSPFKFVTVSIGAVWLFPQPESSVANIVAQADAALYTAKRDGRNRVHFTTANSEREHDRADRKVQSE